MIEFPIPVLQSTCFSFHELVAIPIRDCGESLVDLSTASFSKQDIFCGETPPKLRDYIAHGMWTREGVAAKLIAAQRLLSELSHADGQSLHLFVAYAYRHPEIQRRYFADFSQRIALEHPEWSELAIKEYAHHYMAIPEVGGHPAGAAIDLLIVDEKKRAIDMGSAIGDLTNLELVPPVSSHLTHEQQQHRLLLRHVMTSVGFAPYDFEWWHFSYGDREWACFYNESEARYGEVDFQVR
jgi:D-alanyl-D-alanine dipeptidase